jgi:hypothetical protein
MKAIRAFPQGLFTIWRRIELPKETHKRANRKHKK